MPKVSSPSLPEVDRPSVSSVRLADSPTQSVARLWHRDQVDMVGHQAIRPDFDLLCLAKLSHQINVALVILVAEERL